MPDKDKSIDQGALAPFTRSANEWMMALLKGLAEQQGFTLKTPLRKFTDEQLAVLMYGSKEPVTITYTSRFRGRSRTYRTHFEGIMNLLDRRYRESSSEMVKEEMEHYMSDIPCSACGGKRLKPESLAVTINDLDISDVADQIGQVGLRLVRGAAAHAAARRSSASRSSRKSARGSSSCWTSGWTTSPWTARRPRSRAARPSGSDWRPRSAAG